MLSVSSFVVTKTNCQNFNLDNNNLRIFVDWVLLSGNEIQSITTVKLNSIEDKT